MAIDYVGGQTAGRANPSSALSVNFALTGGLAAAPAEGDLVIVTCVNGSAGANPAMAIVTPTGYTALGLLNQAAATSDTSLDVSYKFMGSTPDTAVTIPGNADNAAAEAYAIQVFRGVNKSKPMDVAAVAAGATGTARCNPAAITPVTQGACTVICGGGASGTGANYTAPANYATNFLTSSGADTTDAMVGCGYRLGWTSGAEDPAAYTGGTNLASDSWASYTLALRPDMGPGATALTELPLQPARRESGLSGFMHGSAFLLLLTSGAPFSQPDWPIPLRAPGQLMIGISTRPAADPVAVPFTPQDWPVPARKVATPPDAGQGTVLTTTLAAPATPIVPVGWTVTLRPPAPPVPDIGQASMLVGTLAVPVGSSATEVPFRAVQTPLAGITGTRLPLDVLVPVVPVEWTVPLRATVAPPVIGAGSLLTTTLFDPGVPFAPIWWAVPRSGGGLLITINTRPSDAPTTTAAPLVPMPWEVPARAQTRPLEIGAPNLLRTTLAPAAPAATPFAGSMQDVPPQPARPRDLTIAGAALTTTLALPVTPIDWPVPVRPGARRDLTITASGLTTTLTTAPGVPFTVNEWPVPVRAPQAPITSRWFAFYYVEDDSAPFLNSADPAPGAKSTPAILRTWTQNLQQSTLAPAVAVPPGEAIADVPTARPSALDLRTWIAARPQFYTDAVTADFGLSEWPIPASRPALASLRSWTHSILTSTLSLIPAVMPDGRQQDWPLPRVAPAVPGLRSHLETRKTYYTDAVTATFGVTDWRVPAPVSSAAHRTWTMASVMPPAFPDGRQQDWPIPATKPSAPGLRSHLETRKPFYTDTVTARFGLSVWPVPSPRPALATLTTWTQNLQQTTLAPSTLDPDAIRLRAVYSPTIRLAARVTVIQLRGIWTPVISLIGEG